MYTCDKPLFSKKIEQQASRMKASYVGMLENLYEANDDVGLQITKSGRRDKIEVECKKAFRSLTLIPWSPMVSLDLSDSSECKGLQCLLGTVDGKYVKVTPKQTLFDKRSLSNMAALCCAMASTLHGLSIGERMTIERLNYLCSLMKASDVLEAEQL